MDIRQMRQVLAIGRHGSFARAAHDLNISQPTLSKSVARLEDELGFKLFDRSGWRAKPTPMGVFIIGRAGKLVDEARRLERDISLMAFGEMGEAKIGLGPTLRVAFMPRLAAEVARRHPDLKLTIVADDRRGLLAGLEAGDYDLALMASHRDVDEQDLVVIDVMTDPAVAVASPDHPLAGRDKISMEEFAEHPTAAGFASRMAFYGVFAMPELSGIDEGGAKFKARISTNDLGTSLNMVRQGLCTYAGARHIVRPGLDAGYFVRLNVDWTYEFHTIAVMTPAASHSPILRQIITHAQHVGAQLQSPA